MADCASPHHAVNLRSSKGDVRRQSAAHDDNDRGLMTSGSTDRRRHLLTGSLKQTSYAAVNLALDTCWGPIASSELFSGKLKLPRVGLWGILGMSRFGVLRAISPRGSLTDEWVISPRETMS
jgi:hypothetical protein